MKKWRCPSLTLIALLALFAFSTPSYAWFCPVSERTGSSTFVCVGMTQNCAHLQSKCCHPVQLPQSRAFNNALFASNFVAIISKQHTGIPHVAYSFWNNLFLVSRNATIRMSAEVSTQVVLSLYLVTQNGPSPFLPRAPPVI